jgi:hypothetical protein
VTMGEYLVEGYLPRPGSDELARAAARARAAANELTRAGTPVCYLGAIFIPGDETCFHLYEAPSAEAARTASARAGIGFERIVAAVVAMTLVPGGLPRSNPPTQHCSQAADARADASTGWLP